MKGLIIILLIFSYSKSFSQCSIKVFSVGDMSVYEAIYENIYKNSDLENGIQAVYLRLLVCQKANDKEKLQFYLKINSAKRGNKVLVVPRQLIIKYNDGKELKLQAEELASMKSQNEFYTQEASFRIYSWLFEDLQTKEISEIVLNDTRRNERIIGRPYPRLIQEQANCIALKLK